MRELFSEGKTLSANGTSGGMVNEWFEGERISCRKSLCVIVPHE